LKIGLATALFGVLFTSPALAAKGDHAKLDRKLNERAKSGGKSRVIVTLKPGWDESAELNRLGGRLGRKLNLIAGRVVELPNNVLRKLADHPGVASIDWDRPTEGLLARAATTTGARAVRQQYGYNGAGVGVVVIDSGVTNWHNDLTYANGTGQRGKS
jgi:subtilisin family serine protease